MEAYLDSQENKRWKMPSKVDTPLTMTYRPELDVSRELNDVDAAYYQSLIGILRWMVDDTFLSMFRLCSCGTKPQRSENHHFVMTSSWEPQCHHDIIMRTPRITGKPKFSWSGGP